MPIQHPTYALPLQSANTIATKQSHDAEINRVVTILVENDQDLNATLERAIVTGPIVGEWDAGTGAFPTLRPTGEQIRVGDTWRVIGNGTVDGQAFYSGDYLQAITAGGGVTFNGNWARAALGQIEADRIAAETAAAEAQAYAEMAEFTRVTVIASGDGTANPITLPIPVDSALRVQVFVNMTRWVPGDDYTVSGYDLAPVSPLVWPEGDRNLLILIDRPFDSMAPTSDDVTHDGQPISQILDRIDAENTFYLQDYLHPDDMTAVIAGNTGSQNETRVTAAVQAFHDAALGWMMRANNRHVTLIYPNVVLAINDEMFSETWAELLWTTGGSRSNCRIVFQFNGVRFQAKNWIARAAVRTSGLYRVRGITYAVPKVMFRWECETPISPRIDTVGRIYLLGEKKIATDPIGVKLKSLNICNFDCFFVQDFRNTSTFIENVFNTAFYNWQVNSTGYQPTEYGGSGFIPATTKFSNIGAVVTATEPVFNSSHVGRRFMLTRAAPQNGQGFQVHSGVIASVDSPTQITLTAAPSKNVVSQPGSFEAVAVSTVAGSNVATLSAPITDSLVGRYATLLGCGQDDIYFEKQFFGSMTAVVTAHSGDQITLAHPARLTRSNIPISFGTTFVMSRGAENALAEQGRNDDVAFVDLRVENGSSPFDGGSMMGHICHASSISFGPGSKFHGLSPDTKNNFGSNFANVSFDYASGITFTDNILSHSGYSSRFGKIILNGGFTAITMTGQEVVYPDTNETASFYVDPTQSQISTNVLYGNYRNDGRVGNAVKARYGAYGLPSMIRAANSATRILRGIDVIDGGEGEDTIVGTGTTPAIPDWPTDLHDVIATGDVFAPGYGSTRANAASRIAAGFWTPQNGRVYTIGGLQYLGQTGATAIADLPGLVWAGERDVRHFGAESGAADVLAAFVAARDSVPVGQAGKVIVPPGVWNISAPMSANYNNFVEWIIQDGAQVMPSVAERLSGLTRRIVHPRTGAPRQTRVQDVPQGTTGGAILSYDVVRNTGFLDQMGYGRRYDYSSSAYGFDRFDIADGIVAGWTRDPGQGGGQMLTQWLVALSPTTGDDTWDNSHGTFVAEWNIVNRGADTGFAPKRGNLKNFTGGLQMVIEDDGFLGSVNTKNVTFGIMFGGQTPTGNAVDKRRFYAGLLGEPDAIAGETGRAIFWTGDTTGQANRIPLSFVEAVGRWGYGLKLNDGTFSTAAIAVPNGSKISWQSTSEVEAGAISVSEFGTVTLGRSAPEPGTVVNRIVEGTGATNVQRIRATLWRTATDPSSMELTTNGNVGAVNNTLSIPDNSAATFSGDAIALDASGNVARWTFSGIVQRGVGAATTVVKNVTATKTYFDAAASTWVVTVTANTVTGGLWLTMGGTGSYTTSANVTLNMITP